MNRSLIQFVRTYRYQLGLALVLILAVFLRFYRLDVLPPGLHPDEAANGLDALRILENHDFRPLYNTNGGREGLLFYLQAISVAIFGTTTLALRLVTAAIGVVAVGAMYLWMSSWFGRRTALIGTLLLAVSPWAITIARDGFRAGLVVLMVPLIFWLYTKAVRTSSLRWYAAAGLGLGVGCYTYTSYYFLPLALAAILVVAALLRREQVRQWLPGIATSLAVATIVLVPWAFYVIQHPGDIFGRPGSVSVFNEKNPVQALGSSTVKTALMFNVSGDQNYRHNLGGQPQFNIFVGTMFALGLLICAVWLRRLRYAALFIAFIILLLPAILTAEGSPHALRAIGTLPLGIAMAALGTVYLLDLWRGVFPLNVVARVVGSTLVGLLLLLTAYHGYTHYFIAWANDPQTYTAYNEDATSLARYYNNHSFDGRRYAVSEEYAMKPVAFLTHKRTSYRLISARDINKLPLERSRGLEFSVLTSEKDTVLPILSAKYPKGKARPHYSPFDDRELFVIYLVPSS